MFQSVYFYSRTDLIIGFAELESNGHIVCFYCHYRCQGKGVGKQIYRALETQAKKLNLARLYTESSITAKPFFIKQDLQ